MVRDANCYVPSVEIFSAASCSCGSFSPSGSETPFSSKGGSFIFSPPFIQSFVFCAEGNFPKGFFFFFTFCLIWVLLFFSNSTLFLPNKQDMLFKSFKRFLLHFFLPSLVHTFGFLATARKSPCSFLTRFQKCHCPLPRTEKKWPAQGHPGFIPTQDLEPVISWILAWCFNHCIKLVPLKGSQQMKCITRDSTLIFRFLHFISKVWGKGNILEAVGHI